MLINETSNYSTWLQDKKNLELSVLQSIFKIDEGIVAKTEA